MIHKSQCKNCTMFILCILFSFAVIIDANTLARLYSTTSTVEPQVSIDEKSNEIFEVCTTAECIRSAKEILSAMNTSVDPCDDFYQFTCGRWGTEQQILKGFTENSMFGLAKQNALNDVLKLVKSNGTEDEPTPLRKSRDLFRSCMDQESRENLSYDVVFKYLSQLGLPAVPRFFNMSDMDDDITDYKFDWMKTDVAFHALFRAQLLVNCQVGANVFNSSQIVSNCKYPENKFRFHNISLTPFHVSKLFDVEIYSQEQTAIQKAWQKFTNFSITTLIKEKYELPADFQERFDAAIEIINKTENEISQIKENSKNFYYGYIDLCSLEDLQTFSNGDVVRYNRIPKLIWEQYLKESFSYSNLTIDIDKKDKILINYSEEMYYRKINEFLSKTSEVELELWAWWRAVLNLIIHTTSDVSEYVDEIFKATDISTELPREMVCSRLTNFRMDFAIAYSLRDQFFQNATKPKIKEILNNINEAFEMRVNALAWMDEKTKKLTIEKSKVMTDFIGYPEWLENKTILESFYSSITVNPDTYLDNLIEFNKFTMKYNLEQFYLSGKKEWPREVNVMEINAFNMLLSNTIALPFALVNYVFHNRGLEVLNYGATGCMLGHELTHGFDTSGRYFDKSGSIREWWSEATTLDFINMTKCFIEQYDQFYVPASDTYLNGSITLGEALADNGGLHHAYLAYQNHKKKNDEKLRLPGLEQFTNNQLFFISYANFWCSTDDQKYLKTAHCPNKYRVLGNVVNSEEFAQAFNCPVGSNMNPKKSKCTIW